MDRHNELNALCANTQAMGLPDFLAQANPMMAAVDGAMDRMFSKPQTREEIHEQLERAEDDFLARKEMQSRLDDDYFKCEVVK